MHFSLAFQIICTIIFTIYLITKNTPLLSARSVGNRTKASSPDMYTYGPQYKHRDCTATYVTRNLDSTYDRLLVLKIPQ